MQYLEPIATPIRLFVMIACLCCNIGLTSYQAQADDAPMPMQIDIDDDVVYCSIGPVAAVKPIQHALQEGTSITFRWTFMIEEISTFWMNHHIGTVTMNRQVIPDLVSRTWILKDGSSGIEKRVFSFTQAMQFLLHVERFPMLDQSLLQAGNQFIMQVDLYVDEGETDISWWSEMIRFDNITSSQEFSLP